MSSAATLPKVTVFGRTTCEDTAIVRDRLLFLDVPFTDVDLDRDAGAARLVESLNSGNQVTPTVLFGGVESAMAEPSLDALDARLIADGWPIRRPVAESVRDQAAVAGALPAVVGPDGREIDIERQAGGHQLLVFLPHAADCLGCSGYARQIARALPGLADGGARALVVVMGEPDAAARWVAESTDKVPIVADQGGRWRQAMGASIAPTDDGTSALLVALDADLVPRLVTVAADAGGLTTPGQAADWFVFNAAQSRADDTITSEG